MTAVNDSLWHVLLNRCLSMHGRHRQGITSCSSHNKGPCAWRRTAFCTDFRAAQSYHQFAAADCKLCCLECQSCGVCIHSHWTVLLLALNDATGSAGAEGMSFFFVWMRLSSMKQLDWYRNSSYQSKDIAHVQKTTTQRIADKVQPSMVCSSTHFTAKAKLPLGLCTLPPQVVLVKVSWGGVWYSWG